MSIKIHNINTITELDSLKLQTDFNIDFIHNYKTALFKSNLTKTHWLLKNKINIHYKDKKGKTALFYVKSPDKLSLLLSAGINPYHLDQHGRSFLYYMDKKMISYLLSDKNHLDLKPILNKRDKGLDPLLFQISSQFELKDFQKFVNKGGNLFIRNIHKQDILHELYYDRPELIIPLLNQFKFKNIDTIYTNGCVPANLENTGNFLLSLTEEPEKHSEIIEYLWNYYNKDFINMFEQIKTLDGDEIEGEKLFIAGFIIEKERIVLQNNFNKNKHGNQAISRI